MSKPKLISFKLCPFVQRSVILLKEKQVDYDIEFIDIMDPPDWFKEISPMGKVPVMQIDNEVLFESAVINEYLDEVYPEPLHPDNALSKAKNRAWVEFTSNLYMQFFNLMMSTTDEDVEKNTNELKGSLAQLNSAYVYRPWFNGDDFSLVDVAVSPAFWRINFLKENTKLDLLADFPELQQWSDAVLARETVQTSVVPELSELLMGRLKANGNPLV